MQHMVILHSRLLLITLCALQNPVVSRLAVNFKTAQYALELMSSYGLDGLDVDPEQDSGGFKTILKVGGIWSTPRSHAWLQPSVMSLMAVKHQQACFHSGLSPHTCLIKPASAAGAYESLHGCSLEWRLRKPTDA